MKNKLFLALSLLTAGLTVQASLMVPTNLMVPMANLNRQFALAGAGLCAMPVALGSVYSYRNEILNGMDSAMAHKMASQYGVTYASKQLSKRERLTNALNSTKTFVGNHKVATGASVAAVVGLGLAYKYRKNLFGKATKTTIVETPKLSAEQQARIAERQAKQERARVRLGSL